MKGVADEETADVKPATPPSADEVFRSPLSRPMPAAANAARRAARGEDLPDELRDTDAALVAAFALETGDRLKFDHTRRTWMVCDPSTSIWRPDDSAAASRALQSFVEDSVFTRAATAASKRDLEAVRRTVRRDLSASSLRRNLDLAATQGQLADSGLSWDQDVAALATSDGKLVDLTTGGVRALDPSDRITLTTRVPLEPSAKCERWRRFMREISDGDRSRETLLRRALGYSITADISEQVFFLEIGGGANGKGTKAEQIAYVLGGYAKALPFTILTRDRDARGVQGELAQMPGVRFATASEVRENTYLDEGRLKSFTGGDTVSAAHKYGRPFTFRPTFKLWLQVNHRPRVSDRSHGFWRRVVLIDFKRTFAIDKTLEPALRDEAPGVLAWLVEAAMEWRQHGLPRVEAAETEKSEWRESEDLIGQWAALALVSDPHGCIRAAAAFDAFVAWAEQERISERERPNSRSFGEWMGASFAKKRTKVGAVYAARLVLGDGSVPRSGNPLGTRLHEGTLPNTHHHPTPVTDLRRRFA